LAYVLSGQGYAGGERRPVDAHQLVVFGPGDSVVMGAAGTQPEDSPNFEVLLLGGLPIREPIAHHGPFLMNTRAEIVQAIEDYSHGRMGSIPAIERPVSPRT
jgi:redox-sensitive bicupin YhaK (pirin superfamily)